MPTFAIEKAMLIATSGERLKMIVARIRVIDNELQQLGLELLGLQMQLAKYMPVLKVEEDE